MTVDEVCPRSDLPKRQCAHCRPPVAEAAPLIDGPTIEARFDGRCAGCGTPYGVAELIAHSTEADGWIRLACCGGQT